MTTTALSFPRATRSAAGYNVDEVEAFIANARVAYDVSDYAPQLMTSAGIRQVSFSLQKRGYDASLVDAALERLELAFAQRERELAIEREGWESFSQRTKQNADALRERFDRETGHRFRRVGPLSQGYNRADVDAFVNDVRAYLEQGVPLRTQWVRNAVFRPQRGGYSEVQVDIAIDALLDVMIASGQG